MAVALAALEIALKEAPQRGWISGLVLGLLALSWRAVAASCGACCGDGADRRSAALLPTDVSRSAAS